MASNLVRSIKVQFEGDAKDLEKTFSETERKTLSFSKATVAAGAVLGGLGVAASKAFGELIDSQKVAAQTAAVLKSTGGAANVTAGHISNLAGSLLNVSGVDDEAIQSMENVLLTFTRVRNESGKGNDVFDQTTKVVLDMSTALGTDLKDQAIQVGKALNDPVKGITALQRVGVTFTDGQRKQIAALVKSGNTLKAQKLILHELNKEFGGSAKAAGDTFSGSINKARENALNFGAQLVQGALPTLDKLGKGLASATVFMQKHGTATKIVVGIVAGLSLAVLGVNVAMKAYSAVSAVAKAATTALNLAMEANPFVLVATLLVAIGAALVVAYTKSETFRRIVNAAFGAVKTVATDFVSFFTTTIPNAFKTVKTWVSDHWPEIATLISGPFAPLVALATGAFGIRDKFEAALKGVKKFAGARVADVVGFFVRMPSKLAAMLSDLGKTFTAPLKAAFQAAADFVRDDVIGSTKGGGIVGWFAGLPGTIGGFASSMATAFLDKLGKGLASLGKSLLSWIIDPINKVIGLIDSIGIPVPTVSIDTKKIPGLGISIPTGIHVGTSGSVHPFNIPPIKLAEGGIVRRPTIALIGEAGPEAVVPLGRGGGATGAALPARGGGPLVNIEGDLVMQNGTDAELFAGRVNRRLLALAH